MASTLTSIADRLTPSAPIEITYGAQPVAVGTKVTTIFAHRAATGGNGQNYVPLDVVNVGDPDAAQAEVDALAGTGSQAGKMAYAFVAANAFVGRSRFPAFRIILIPNALTTFGPADEAIVAARTVRTDMFVSCYPASDTANRTKLLDLCALISGPDRDLNGQFGSFVTFGSVDVLATAVAYAINSRYAQVAYLQDTNTASVNPTGVVTSGSDTITAISATDGINVGATITGTGIAAGAKVLSITGNTVQMSSVATATAAAAAITFQNVVSQTHDILAAAHAGAQMASGQPYNPLHGVAIGGLVAPRKRADWILIDPSGASETALRAGLSPLTIQPGSVVGFVRTRLTLVFKPDGVTRFTDYIDWQSVVALYDFRESLYQVTQNPPFNNNPGGAKASAALLGKFKDEVLREAFEFEKIGMFQNVKILAKYFQADIPSRGRFDVKVPADVVPGLYVMAGNIQGISDALNFSI